VTYDNHNDGFYNSNRVGKDIRTFYITPEYSVDDSGKLTKTKDAPKISKVIFASRSKKIGAYPSIYVGTAAEFQNKLDTLKQYVVTDVKSSTNTYKFKTNFEKNRVVVTRLAYEEGFTLKMVDESGKKTNVEVFNGQGGFVSFVSGTGNCSYTLEFYTPYLKIASYISMIGVTAFIGSIVGYLYLDMRKKEKEMFILK